LSWKQEPESPVIVLRTSDVGVVSVAESLLEGVGIPYFAKGEVLQNIIGIGQVGGYNVVTGPVQIEVPANPC
jgi:hypothetical protein